MQELFIREWAERNSQRSSADVCGSIKSAAADCVSVTIGLTSLVDARGKILQSLPMFVPDMLKTEVDILESQTYYVRFGDGFAWWTTIIAVALLLRLKRAE